MSALVIVLILASVSISALAQIVLKHGVSSPSVQSSMAQLSWINAWTVLANPFVLGGFILYGLGAILWLGVLARIDVSQAYPFVSLGFVMTMALAHFIIGESISYLRFLGTLLILMGVVLVGMST